MTHCGGELQTPRKDFQGTQDHWEMHTRKTFEKRKPPPFGYCNAPKKTNLNPKCATKYENAINGLPFAGFFPQYFRDSPRGRKCCHQWPLMSWQRRAGPFGLDKSRHAFSDPVPAFFVARVLFGCGGYPLLISHISHHIMKNGPFIDD